MTPGLKQNWGTENLARLPRSGKSGGLDGRTYAVPVPQGKELKGGEVVTVEIAEFPFAGSICMVFILPVVLMVLFPAVSTAIGKAVDIPLLCKGWFVICAGISGFAAAFIFNFCIDRRFRRKYPPRIGHEEGADA